MKKFILITRGRTGSTAVMDELNKSTSIATTQELFIKKNFNPGVVFGETYKWATPFDHWKLKFNFPSHVLPFVFTEKFKAKRYLLDLDNLARKTEKKVFGWKLLSHHLKQRPYLSKLISDLGYSAIYLKRNLVTQVLSGMVANAAGLFNTREEFKEISRHQINVDDFKWHVDLERQSVNADRNMLVEMGVNFIEVNYEDFQSNKKDFYASICNFLQLPCEVPPSSDFKKIIRSYSQHIKNIGEITEAALEMGVALDN